MPYIVGTSLPSTLEMSAGSVRSSISTTTSTSESLLVSVPKDDFRSVNYQIQAVQGTNYNTTTINVVHDGTNAYMSEFGTINEPVGISTFSTDISAGNLRLLGYPASNSSTTFKVVFTAIKW